VRSTSRVGAFDQSEGYNLWYVSHRLHLRPCSTSTPAARECCVCSGHRVYKYPYASFMSWYYSWPAVGWEDPTKKGD
jgi:hypothetical protein